MILNNKGLRPIETLNDEMKKLNLYFKSDEEQGRLVAHALIGKIKFCFEYGLITVEEWESLNEKMVLFLYGD